MYVGGVEIIGMPGVGCRIVAEQRALGRTNAGDLITLLLGVLGYPIAPSNGLEPPRRTVPWRHGCLTVAPL